VRATQRLATKAKEDREKEKKSWVGTWKLGIFLNRKVGDLVDHHFSKAKPTLQSFHYYLSSLYTH
jgi:hypothetical protein